MGNSPVTLITSKGEKELEFSHEALLNAYNELKKRTDFKVIYKGAEYPNLCALCPHGLFLTVFPEEAPCKINDCLRYLGGTYENPEISD